MGRRRSAPAHPAPPTCTSQLTIMPPTLRRLPIPVHRERIRNPAWPRASPHAHSRIRRRLLRGVFVPVLLRHEHGGPTVCRLTSMTSLEMTPSASGNGAACRARARRPCAGAGCRTFVQGDVKRDGRGEEGEADDGVVRLGILAWYADLKIRLPSTKAFLRCAPLS